MALPVLGGRQRGGGGLLSGDVHRGAARLSAPARGLEPARVGADDRPSQGARRAPGARSQSGAGGGRRRALGRTRRSRRPGGATRRCGTRWASCPRASARRSCCATSAISPPRDRRRDRLLGGGGAALAARGTDQVEKGGAGMTGHSKTKTSRIEETLRRRASSADARAQAPAQARRDGRAEASDARDARRAATRRRRPPSASARAQPKRASRTSATRLWTRRSARCSPRPPGAVSCGWRSPRKTPTRCSNALAAQALPADRRGARAARPVQARAR